MWNCLSSYYNSCKLASKALGLLLNNCELNLLQHIAYLDGKKSVFKVLIGSFVVPVHEICHSFIQQVKNLSKTYCSYYEKQKKTD